MLPKSSCFEGQVGEKQVMIDDDQVRFLGALVHRGKETLLKFAGISGRSRCRGARRCATTAPNRPARNVSSARSPVSVSFRPIANLAESVDFLHALQHGLVGHGVHLCEAQEIGAAFHHRDFQFRSEVLLQERDVFLKELFLKRFRGGGDHDAAAAADCGEQ